MPYNWYETKSNSPDVSDLTQGTILTTCDLETDDQTALLELVFEFQTLEDPDFLAAMAHDSRVRMIRPQMTARHQLDDYEEISEEEVRRSDSIESRSAFRKGLGTILCAYP
jgi:hypothetical protein